MKSFPKTVIIISGPTSVGKTAIAIFIAKHFGTEIISADSRQCYRELNIGVARPSVQELETIPHHFIASHSIHQTITAVDFEKYALSKTAELHKHHDWIVMVGGTGLYIKSFVQGLDQVPDIDPLIRKNIIKNYETSGIQWLLSQLEENDPLFISTGEIRNPQRMMRALEVVQSTGQSILNFQKGKKRQRDFRIVQIGLELPRQELVDNINNRVEQMMSAGLLEEVKSLIPYKSLNALSTVGYAELFDHFDGKISLDDAIERIKINTRQYAKRQMTWFKKEELLKWISPKDPLAILHLIGQELGE